MNIQEIRLSESCIIVPNSIARVKKMKEEGPLSPEQLNYLQDWDIEKDEKLRGIGIGSKEARLLVFNPKEDLDALPEWTKKWIEEEGIMILRDWDIKLGEYKIGCE
jgi:hypothetical protein